MTHLLRTLALCFGLALSAPAWAHDGPAAAAKATEAATALQTFGDSARLAGRRPDFAAAPAAALLHDMFDADRLAALPGPASDDMPWLADWTEAANRGYKQMIMVGLSPGQPPDEAILARNLHDYEDQIALALNFQIRAMAREIDAAALFLAELPKAKLTRIRIEGFRGFRASAGGFLQTTLCTARAMTPVHARMLMAAVIETRASWSNGLSADDRRGAVAELEQMLKDAGDSEVTADATRVLTAFAVVK